MSAVFYVMAGTMMGVGASNVAADPRWAFFVFLALLPAGIGAAIDWHKP